MADEPDPIDQLLDAALYVPLGLFLELRERFPELAERGRQHLTTQVSVARMVGQFAVQMGSKQVGSFLARPRAAEPTAEPTVVDDPVVAATESAFSATTVADVAAPAPAPAAEVTADDLPIAGYDTLAASQIVARLDGLAAEQLAAVAAYEAAHRNRKTVLGKLDQLERSA